MMSTTDEAQLTVTDFFDLADELVEEELEKLVEETVDELTEVTLDGLVEETLTDLIEGREPLSRFQLMKERIQAELQGYVVPDAFYDMLFKHVMELLNIEIPDLLTEAWSKYEELAKYLDEENYPPGDTFYSPLAGHTFTSAHNPSLRPTINRIPLGSIKIAAQFSLALKGVLLQIKDGKIEGFKIGECVGNGQLSIQGVQLVKKTSKPWSIPKMYMLPDPIQIPDVKQMLKDANVPDAAVSELEKVIEQT